MIRLFLTLAFFLFAAPAWAFPTNAVLETFTGADDTTPPNANWTNAPINGASSANVRIRSNGATTASAGTEADAYWDTTTFNANQESYVTLTLAGAATYSCVGLRLVNIGGSTTDGYVVCAVNSATAVLIYRVDNATWTQIGTIAQTVASGDSVGGTAIGSRICSWYKVGAGAWTEKQCVNDATYTAGGNIGLVVVGDTTQNVADNFGGGNVSAARGGPIFLQ